MAQVPIQVWPVTGTGGASAQSSAAPGNVTAGNTIYVSAGIFTGSASISSVKDTLGNTYVPEFAGTSSGSPSRLEVWRCSNCLGGANVKITVTASSSTSGMVFGAIEVAGSDNTGAQDGSGSSQQSFGSNPAPGSFSTTNANDIILVAYSDNSFSGNHAPIVAPSGYTLIGSYADADTFTVWGFAYQVVTATQSGIDPAFSETSGGNWICAALAYKAATGGTTYTQSLSGSCTPTGELKLQTSIALAGGSTPAGALAKQAAKPLAGSATASGALAKLTAKPLAGSVASAGTLQKQANKSLSGIATPSGTLSALKVTLLVIGGVLAAAGALAKRVAKSLVGFVTGSGTLSTTGGSQPFTGRAVSLPGVDRSAISLAGADKSHVSLPGSAVG